jgi:hypothetical protein
MRHGAIVQRRALWLLKLLIAQRAPALYVQAVFGGVVWQCYFQLPRTKHWSSLQLQVAAQAGNLHYLRCCCCLITYA